MAVEWDLLVWAQDCRIFERYAETMVKRAVLRVVHLMHGTPIGTSFEKIDVPRTYYVKIGHIWNQYESQRGPCCGHRR